MRAIDGAAWGLVTIYPSVYDSGAVVLYGLTSHEQQTLHLIALGYSDEAISKRVAMRMSWPRGSRRSTTSFLLKRTPVWTGG
jgi:hypothetical protein